MAEPAALSPAAGAAQTRPGQAEAFPTAGSSAGTTSAGESPAAPSSADSSFLAPESVAAVAEVPASQAAEPVARHTQLGMADSRDARPDAAPTQLGQAQAEAFPSADSSASTTSAGESPAAPSSADSSFLAPESVAAVAEVPASQAAEPVARHTQLGMADSRDPRPDAAPTQLGQAQAEAPDANPDAGRKPRGPKSSPKFPKWLRRERRPMLIEGLPRRQVFLRFLFYVRGNDVMRRAAAFYLYEIDSRKLYQSDSYPSAVAYAELAANMSRREAVELLRVGKALAMLTLIDEAFRKGELGWSKVREITRVAKPETEAKWLAFAKASTTTEVEAGVSGREEGEEPPKDGLDTRPPVFRLRMTLSVEAHTAFDQALSKIMDESKEPLSPSQAVKKIADLVLALEPDGTAPGWRRRTDASQVVIYHRCPACHRSWVISDRGDVPVSKEAVDEAERNGIVMHVGAPKDPGDTLPVRYGQRGTCPPELRDKPTPPVLRMRILFRDGARCVICRRKKKLRPHHLESLCNGGKTAIDLEVLACEDCHGLGHVHLLQIRVGDDGRPIGLDMNGHPLHRLGGPAAQLDPDAEEYPLLTYEIVEEGDAEDVCDESDDAEEEEEQEDQSAPDEGESEPAASDPPAEPGYLPDPLWTIPDPPPIPNPAGSATNPGEANPAGSGANQAGSAPGLPAASGAGPAEARSIRSIDELPETIPSSTWRRMRGGFDWVSSRGCFVLRSSAQVLPDPACPDPRADRREDPNPSGPPGAPLRLEEFVGQQSAVERIALALGYAKAKGTAMEHALFYGPAGLGKTSLAFLSAAELGTQLHATTAPAIETPMQLLNLLANLGERDVFLIDEIHRLPIPCIEYLYGAMQGGVVDFRVAQGANERTLHLLVSPFTLIGATTEPGMLPHPMQTRFQIRCRLDPYTDEELATIVERAAARRGMAIAPAAAQGIAKRSRGTPREALTLLGCSIEVAVCNSAKTIEKAHAIEAARIEGVDEEGLRREHHAILRLLVERNHPMGIRSIATALNLDERSVALEYEPFLYRLGYIERTLRGRVATEKAKARVA